MAAARKGSRELNDMNFQWSKWKSSSQNKNIANKENLKIVQIYAQQTYGQNIWCNIMPTIFDAKLSTANLAQYFAMKIRNRLQKFHSQNPW